MAKQLKASYWKEEGRGIKWVETKYSVSKGQTFSSLILFLCVTPATSCSSTKSRLLPSLQHRAQILNKMCLLVRK